MGDSGDWRTSSCSPQCNILTGCQAPVRRYASIFECGKIWDLQATIQTRRLTGPHLSLAATIKGPSKISTTRCAAGCPAALPVPGCICRRVACTGMAQQRSLFTAPCEGALPWLRILSLHVVTLLSHNRLDSAQLFASQVRPVTLQRQCCTDECASYGGGQRLYWPTLEHGSKLVIVALVGRCNSGRPS